MPQYPTFSGNPGLVAPPADFSLLSEIQSDQASPEDIRDAFFDGAIDFGATLRNFASSPSTVPHAFHSSHASHGSHSSHASHVSSSTGSYSSGSSTNTIAPNITIDYTPVLANPIGGQSLTTGIPFIYRIPANSFQDAGGDVLTFSVGLANGQSLPSWLNFDRPTATLSGTAPSGSPSLTIRVNVTDPAGHTVYGDFSIASHAPPDNAPVVVVPLSDQSAAETQAFTFSVPPGSFVDPEGQPLTYSASLSTGGNLPQWLAFSGGNQTFLGTAPAGSSDLSVRVTATDPAGHSISDDFTLITLAAPDKAPVLAVALDDQSAAETQAFTFTVPPGSFVDPEGQPLTYSASLSTGGNLPQWLAFSGGNQTFLGTAPAGSSDLSVRVTATDPAGHSISDDFTLFTTAAPDKAPVLAVALDDQTATESQAFGFTLPLGKFRDPEGLALTYSARSAGGGNLPDWLSFNSGDITFRGVPPAGCDDLTISITATDPGGHSVSDEFTLFTQAASDEPPVLRKSLTSRKITEGTAFSFKLSAGSFADPEGLPLSFRAIRGSGSALPGWLGFDPGDGRFFGTAPLGSPNLNISVTATDAAGQSVSGNFKLTTMAPKLAQSPLPTTVGSTMSLIGPGISAYLVDDRSSPVVISLFATSA